MVKTRTGLDLSSQSIHQVIANQGQEQRVIQSNTTNYNTNMTDPNNANSSCHLIKHDSSITMIDSGSSDYSHTAETKTTIVPQLDDETSTITAQQFQTLTDGSEDRELQRAPYYNGKTNIYAWLIAIKSVFIDLKYDEYVWTNKAKYYLLDDAAQFAYLHDDEMTNWKAFQKLMIDRFSLKHASDAADPLKNTSTNTNTIVQHTTQSFDTLAHKTHQALILEDLKTLPKFSGNEPQSMTSWLEEIELVYEKALITDMDKCHRTLKLLSNADEEWLECIRRQKLKWNELKQKLLSRFEGKKDPSRIQREDEIRNRRLHGNESMHHYYSDIMRKCDLLEKEYRVSDRHRIDYIIRGLPNSMQDQLLTREYSAPKELLEVLQKIEESRTRTSFEQHVVSIDEHVSSLASTTTPPLRTTFTTTSNVHLNTPHSQQPFQVDNNTLHTNQLQNHLVSPHYYNPNPRTPSYTSSNYNQQRPREQYRSFQCYNCGKFGHKAVDCFKSKQRLN